MLRIQIIGLAIVSALLMSAVAAGSASAETELHHQWLLYHSQSGIHLLLAAPIRVHSLGLILLEDHGPGAGVRIHCHAYDTGTVGPHGLDLVESITLELLGSHNLILCLYDKVPSLSCNENKMPDVQAIHLPWRTELVLRAGLLTDLILADGNGRPGYRVTCINVLGGTTEDTCVEEAGKPARTVISNQLNGVLGEFNTISPLGECTIGGKEAGLVSGFTLTENPSPTLLLLISPLD
jgi:hypothetical protein